MIFDWDKKTQDFILSSFYWGYMPMQLPAGLIAIKYGGKIPIVIALFVNGIGLCLTPVISILGGWKAICAVRLIQGFAQGLLMSCIQGLLGRWAPVEERGRLAMFVHGGGFLGGVIMMALTGYLSSTSFGWACAFYLMGALCFLFGLMWYIIGANSPAEHKYITEKEKHYIQSSIGHNTTKKVVKAPWRAILTSVPVWALCVAHIGQSWGQNMITNQMPAFMSKVMKVNITESGSISALPFLGKWVALIIFGFIFDYLINRKLLTVVAARKVAQTIGSSPVALGIILLTYMPKNIILVQILLITIGVLYSGTSLGCMINHLDLSPNYSGTLMSLTNFCANLVSTFAPITAGFILTEDDTNIHLWRIVFFITAGIFFFTNLVFVIFGSGTTMPWDDPDYKYIKSKENDAEVTGVLEELTAVFTDESEKVENSESDNKKT